MLFHTIKRYFENGNTFVIGERGCGKDMLFANICARRNIPYISNTEYSPKNKKRSHAKFYPLEPYKLNCGGNTYKNFIDGNVKRYVYPYADGTDIYISDSGIYFPSQFCNELNRDYKEFPVFFALSRQLGQCNIHVNSQAIGRIWDKIREQGSKYILCNWCKVYCGIVIQKVTIYERYQSIEAKIPPFKAKLGAFSKKEMRNLLEIEKMKYQLQHGEIRSGILIYRNKSDYNTRIFKEILENGN